MKRLLSLLLLLVPASLLLAQEQVRVWKEGDSKRFTTSEILFSEDGTVFSIGDSTYNYAEVDSITVVHTVTVTFSGETASVDLGHAKDVTYEVDGAHVNILSTNTKSELEFVVQGESTQGSLTYDGPLKCKFYLNGLNLTSDRGAAIDIQCGKRIDLILMDGTENVLVDAAGGTQKAAFYCKGHLEVSGSGSLTVTGNTKHAIATKEYLELKKSTGSITVLGAVSDAMHIGQYFQMNGGTLNLSGMGGEGIQVEILTLDDDVTPNPDKENNGLTFIKGGNITIDVANELSKGIKAPGDMTISGGTFNITASGNGSRGIQTSGNLLINEDDGTTLIQIRAAGTIYEDPITEDETRCCGIRVKGNLTATAGTIRISNTGKYSYGIYINGTYTKSGTAVVSASIKTKE
ncbi:MAG: carbohydrate-binding domain-containing protein [Bacteroidaceae bacterium]|nr:carbohydrate-binding domain-containing protein [Bacteroidaceae bacterium]MBQ8454113.1 carbohydrate-binding domain-containing protein [Bacteroidaceae bacterium]MBQ9170215.1 carbohydrate-binding domain-containing protein [Bacteroidaceae bacterium]MBQ9294456.1 carbohydrate-binding domain-containing protein [Bacteroidaceae bacterium]